MDRLFIDTNVLIDVVQKRPDFVADSLSVLKHAHGGAALAAVSALSLSDIAYTLRREELAELTRFYKQLPRRLDFLRQYRFAVSADRQRRAAAIRRTLGANPDRDA